MGVASAFAISLRLRHPTRDVGALLESWGFAPSRTVQVDAPRTTPAGTALEGVWPESYASVPLVHPGAPSLAYGLESALNRIAAKEAALRDFVESGGRAELFVGVQIARNGGDELGWRLMQRLSEYRLSLSLDIYALNQAELEELERGEA